MTKCEAIDLFVSPYLTGISKRFGEPERRVRLYGPFAEINGLSYPSIIEPVQEEENLLGRDVLNQLTATFKGKENKIIFER